MNNCTHAESITIHTRPFTSPVYHPILGTENRAAHGWATRRVECTACGARRLENFNGRHIELGEWSGSRLARQEAALQASRARSLAADARPAPIAVKWRGGNELLVRVEDDGLIHVCSDLRLSDIDRQILMQILPCGWMDAARLVRSTFLEEQQALEAIHG